MAIDNKIIERVQKLLALAGNNPNEAERDAAMSKVHEMLIEHNLSLSEIENTDNDSSMGEKETKQFKNQPWIQLISTSIARLYLCSVFRIPLGKKASYMFIGQKDNVIIAKEVFTWLIISIKKEAGRQRRKLQLGKSYETSFYKGSMESIQERVYYMIRAERDKEITTTGTSLVILRKDIINRATEYRDNKHDLKPGKCNIQSSNSGSGYSAGQEYGNKINIGNVINQSRNTPIT